MRRIYHKQSCPTPSVPENNRNLPDDIISKTVYSEKSELYPPPDPDETKSMKKTTGLQIKGITPDKSSQSFLSEFDLCEENDFEQNNDSTQIRPYPTDSNNDKVHRHRYSASKLIERKSCAWPAQHLNQTRMLGELSTKAEALYEPNKYPSDPLDLSEFDLNKSENDNQSCSMNENAEGWVISSDFYQHPAHQPVKRKCQKAQENSTEFLLL